MPFWPFGRKSEPSPVFPIYVNRQPTWDLEQRALAAFNAKQWQQAEPLYREVIAKADLEGRQVARNMLGQVYEHLARVDDAITQYEANVTERCPHGFYLQRLAIIYRRQNRIEDERRICQAALHIVPNPTGQQWFVDRLRKMK